MSTVGERTYSGRSPQERDDERRQRLHDAAIELFGTQGYAATPVERLCAAAKVSTRHFYQLYDNKEAALLDTYATLTTESFAEVGAALAASEGAPIADRLARGVRAYLEPLMADQRKSRIAFVEVVGVSPTVETRRMEFRRTIVAMIEHEGRLAVARGEIADRDFHFAGMALIGAINSVVHHWMLEPGQGSTEAFEQAVVDLAVTLVLG